MITIYGSPQTSAGRCFWTLEEVGASYEVKTISFKDKEHKSEEFLKVNPNGKVPALVDGDYTIWESMAINMYLAEKYKPELMGESAQQRGLVHQWSIWASNDLQTPMINIFIQLVFVPADKRDEKKITEFKDKLPALLQTIDKALEKSTFLAGDNFSLADLNTASVVNICEHISYDISDYKSINRWLSIINERPAFQKYKALCD